MWVEVVLGAAVLFLLWQVLKKPSDLPPGRWGLPLVGYVPLPFKSLEDHLRDLYKKHGSIYIWRMGVHIMVFLHDQKMAREAFTSTDFIDRPPWQIFCLGEKSPKGVVGSNGLLWQNNRRFALRQLRDLGMGKSKLVAAVHTQAAMMVEEIKKQAGRPARLPHAMSVAVVNIVWQMVGNIQFKVTDPKFVEFRECVELLMDSMKNLAIFDLLPWLGKILPRPILNRICHLDLVENAKEKFFAYFKEVIAEHKKTLDRDNPRDLIDAYLTEMEKENPDSTCSERDLCFLIFDLFNAGSLTTRDTTVWMIFYLANYPRVQEKLQRELDEVLPRGTLPNLEDKPRLPYTEAVVHELLRITSLAALGAQHVATRDTEIGGYTIPKGSIISNVISEIHRDTRHWDNPDDFLPERWITAEGKFSAKKAGFMPFGVGKRQCVGEGLARMEVFMFTVALFQAFTFTPLPGKQMDLRPDTGNAIGHNPRLKQEVVAMVRP
ncbi:cytochrome P450 2L1-like [Scylla paramamosain]|uniref:cytochrome P450 2L1-like n=1 Tax=Scylla paramamosain TaxID=85552 RepID=UPI0030828AD4